MINVCKEIYFDNSKNENVMISIQEVLYEII